MIAETDLNAYGGRHFRFRVTVEDLGEPARSAVGTVSIVFNETCAVADRRRAATAPGRAADDNWHSAATVLVVSALFGTALGFCIVAVSACRRRECCADPLGTVRRVSTPYELARCSQALADDTCVSVQQKLRIVLSDDTAEITIVS